MGVLSWFWPLSMALFGLLFGSLANVLIWRFPRGESVISPGSHCPNCDTLIRWYDNIPLLFWIALRGRCRDCGTGISTRYPFVELLSSVLWFVAAIRFGPTAQSLLCAGFFYGLLVLTFIDLDSFRLPNAIVGTLAAGGALGSIVSQATGVELVPLLSIGGAGWLSQPLGIAAVGAVLGAGLSGAIATLYSRVRGRTGLGMGDVKLLGAMGLFLGPYVVLALLAGSVIGTVGGLADAAHKDESTATHRIPFGPYLALGGVFSVVAGPAVWAWYLSVLGLF